MMAWTRTVVMGMVGNGQIWTIFEKLSQSGFVDDLDVGCEGRRNPGLSLGL